MLFSLALNTRGQSLKLNLNERAEDGQYKKLMMVVPVFGLSKDSVENPLDITTATGQEEIYKVPVKLPVMNKTMRPSYAWLFNGASANTFALSHTLIVIENPGWTIYPTLIWTDRNNNNDLTDDGNPDTMQPHHGVVIHLDYKPNGYEVFLEHFPVTEFYTFSRMSEMEILRIKGNRNFYGLQSCFREKRLNVLATSWKSATDSFSLAIKDINCNGRYNDAGIDMVMIGDLHGEFDNLQGVVLDKKGQAYLEWNNAAYALQKIDPDGGWVSLLRKEYAEMKLTLNSGKKIPGFKYCTATKPQKRMHIKKLRGEYIYIYVWRDGAADYIRDSSTLHEISRKDSSILRILALNYGASGRYIFRYNRYFQTRIIQGFSSNKINKKLKIRKIPTGILISPTQRIIAVGVSPAEAKEIVLTRIKDTSR